MNVATLDSTGRLRLALRGAILSWACFWSWFVVLDGMHDAATLGPGTYGMAGALLAGLWVPAVLGWRRPLLGAVAMALVAAFALWFFHDAVARGFLAGPPVAFALALAWMARCPRSRHSAGVAA